MIGLVYLAPNRLEFQQIAQPACGDDEVLIRVRACSICGSDVHGYMGITGRRTPPMVMGHEFSGEVAAAGSRVTRFKPGDRVVGVPSVGCGWCEQCAVGRPELCQNKRILGVGSTNGAMAEYVTRPEKCLLPIPEGVSFAEAALVEPLSVSLHTFRRRPAQTMEDVGLFGCGTIGLLLLQILRQHSPKRLFVTDIVESKLALARQYGATHTINASDGKAVESILDATQGRGLDVAYEAVGEEATVQDSMAATRAGGDVVMVGNLVKMGVIHLQGLVTREQRLIGCYTGSPQFGPALDQLAAGRVDLSPLLANVWPFERAIEAFQRLAAEDPALRKVVLTMG